MEGSSSEYASSVYKFHGKFSNDTKFDEIVSLELKISMVFLHFMSDFDAINKYITSSSNIFYSVS
jgi:hypothetical protein